ncbi:uncharacterized protein LOC111686925 [Lucilia cuprina]|uniref:uncharacterized protein LOC111686925 n=1 Tax=Lucilia cuprina TaxID=7375 RepID=UPI001F06B2FB|nr:uncharacterized protein LOC111686925 [Lucilia cuprina]
MSDKETERLDNEFNELLKKLEGFMFIYNYREKYLITEWLTKLKNSKTSLEERKLRNRFLKHFVNNQESGVNIFRLEPFNKIPKDFSGPLKDFKKLLPKDPDEALNPSEDEKRSYMADLFDKLPDKGAFLAQQPVPRCGTFFILIVRAEDETPSCPKIE